MPVLKLLQEEFPPISDASLTPVDIIVVPELRMRSAVNNALEKQRLRGQGLSEKEIMQRMLGGSTLIVD